MRVRILTETEIRSLIGPSEALREVREAFVRLARAEVSLPAPVSFEIPQNHGEVHMKGAYICGTPSYAIKIASGF